MQKFSYKTVRDMAINDAIEGFYLMKNPKVKTTQAGKQYLEMKIGDATGEIDAVNWDYAEDIHTVCAGKPVKVRGSVADYKGKRQLTISQIRAPREGDAFDISALVPCAPIDMRATYAIVCNLIESLCDEDYRNLCVEMLGRYRKAFCRIPAAKAVHHSFIGGLLMHTSALMMHCDYLSNYYQFVNRDLLLAGAFCHDLAKVKEYMFTPMGLVSEYSLEGNLLGHLYMGAAEVAEIAKQINMPDEKSLLLQHMLLSHHGKLEYGSPVQPKTAEAMLLSMVDDLDAKMETFREVLEVQEPGISEQKVWSLGYRIYKHPAEASEAQGQTENE